MTKTKSTKSALMLSALAILLCVSMLVGSTFAWFTDSVASENNIIKSGNLDLVVDYTLDGKTWKDLAGAEDLFQKGLWEPGHTEVVKLKVVNEGSLALKYNLSVNVASEVGSVNVYDKPFMLSEFIKFGIVDGAQTYTRDQAIAAVDATATALKAAYNSGTTALEAKNDTDSDEKIVTMVVYMPKSVGNDANYKKGAAVPTINLGINLYATQVEAENDSFDNTYDKDAMTFVKDAAEAQAALDNATSGTIIKLAPGVNYGTLLLRPVDGNANTTTSLNEADGEGLTVYRNEYIRKVENLTIIGAPGATVDAIKVESGYIVNSGSSCNLVDVKGLVIDSVEFTDKADCAPHTYSAPIFFNLTWTDVDGLTVKNCKLIGNDDKVNFVYFTIDGQGAFDGIASNVTLTGNTVDGIARLCELRQTENVTITDNVIKNTVLHGILLPVHNGSYTGDVTITGNTAVGINERFVRMAGAGNANVVIKDNTITDYFGEDDDYIKVTDSNGTPVIENNTMTRAINADSTTTLAQFTDIFANGGSIYLKESVTIDTSSNKNITVHGNVNIYADDNVKIYFPKTTVFGGDGTITIHGGKITTPQELCISGDSKLVIDGGEHTFGAFSATGNGTIVVNDGVLNCKGSYAGVMGISFGETGSLYVNGGKLNMYEPFNLNANRCDAAYIEINGGTIELLDGMADMFVVRNVMDKDVTSGVSRGSSIKITGGTFIAHYEVDSDNDATAFIRNGDYPNDKNKVLVSNIKDDYNCVVTGGTFYGSWQRADNTRYENSDGLMVDNSIEGFVANGYQITGNPDDGYVVSKS